MIQMNNKEMMDSIECQLKERVNNPYRTIVHDSSRGANVLANKDV